MKDGGDLVMVCWVKEILLCVKHDEMWLSAQASKEQCREETKRKEQ